jgi:hypothetical protein
LFGSILVLILDNDSGDPPQLRWTWISPANQPAGCGPLVEIVIVTEALRLAETLFAASFAQA